MRKIWLTAAHVPGVENVEADAASRIFSDDTEWTLHPHVFEHLVQRFGTPDIDLFASRLNCRVKPFCSWQPDPEALHIDSLNISWDKWFGYAFPPFALMSTVLQKIKMEGARVLVVAPDWPTKPWYSLFQEMLITPPIEIPVTDETLFLPYSSDRVHPLTGKLRLLAGIVCSRTHHRIF